MSLCCLIISLNKNGCFETTHMSNVNHSVSLLSNTLMNKTGRDQSRIWKTHLFPNVNLICQGVPSGRHAAVWAPSRWGISVVRRPELKREVKHLLDPSGNFLRYLLPARDCWLYPHVLLFKQLLILPGFSPFSSNRVLLVYEKSAMENNIRQTSPTFEVGI